MIQLKQKHQSELSKLTRDYDERMLTLMKQLPPCGVLDSSEHKITEKEMRERLKIQQEAIDRCSDLQEQLNVALHEIEQLKEQMARPRSPIMK